MNRIAVLDNAVMPYAWGDRHTLADLLGKPVPSPEPGAELWIGAHPKAPSKVHCDGLGWRSLAELIGENPVGMLGARVSAAFGNQLPFLFKILAVAQPLSLQAHPDHAAAGAGFQRENRLAIPLDAPRRNYRDDRGKPECVCAVTPFTALCGFRPRDQALRWLAALMPHGTAGLVHLAQTPGASGLQAFLRWLLTLPENRIAPLCRHAIAKAAEFAGREAVFQWVQRLGGRYPTDAGIFGPALLNLVQLAPGQALLLPAGELHAYLEGVAVELMANSDNVLRGGLTAKHMDVDELLRILRFEERAVAPLRPRAGGPGERIYPSGFEEFELAEITVGSAEDYLRADIARSLEILFCLEGRARVIEMRSPGEQGLAVRRGEALAVPATAGRYAIRGSARFLRAAVPDGKG
jgi:mannose-6-phosphate isomerase